MDIQKVKEKRNTGVVAYSRYCQEKRKFKTHLFCFFEGEDAKYYCPRIEKYCGYTYDKIVVYNCGGRKGVFTALKKIEQDNDDESIKCAFFIDSDYDPQKYSNLRLYQTPCYSIENFYVSKDAFGKMLTREFGINCIDADFTKVCNEYCLRLQEFHEKTMYLNAWLSCQRFYEEKDEKQKVQLSDFKLSVSLSVDIDEVLSKQKFNQEKLLERFPKAKEISEDEIEDKIRFFKAGECEKLFRGKFELEFLKKIIDSLVKKNTDGGFFSVKYTSVNINPYINTLSALTEYADTPEDLVEFLEQYRIA